MGMECAGGLQSSVPVWLCREGVQVNLARSLAVEPVSQSVCVRARVCSCETITVGQRPESGDAGQRRSAFPVVVEPFEKAAHATHDLGRVTAHFHTPSQPCRQTSDLLVEKAYLVVTCLSQRCGSRAPVRMWAGGLRFCVCEWPGLSFAVFSIELFVFAFLIDSSFLHIPNVKFLTCFKCFLPRHSIGEVM